MDLSGKRLYLCLFRGTLTIEGGKKSKQASKQTNEFNFQKLGDVYVAVLIPLEVLFLTG